MKNRDPTCNGRQWDHWKSPEILPELEERPWPSRRVGIQVWGPHVASRDRGFQESTLLAEC